MTDPIVIAGSGLAGYTLARELRKRDKDVPITVISRDHAGFYSKPMLSNALSKQQPAASLVMKLPEAMARELNATVIAHTTLVRIDAASQKLRVHDGVAESVVGYHALVLALGSDPVQLSLEGDGAPDVLSVNDLDDFERFTARLGDVARVAVLGAGLIGCEFANDLLSRGVTPTLVDPAPHPLAALLPPAAAAVFRKRLEAAGAVFRLKRMAKRIDRAGTGYRITLDDGSTTDAELVLSAVGLRPRIAVAQAAGARVGRGIQTDAFLETSLPNVYAIGDCAEVAGVVRPYVMPIMHQARALAASLTGTRTELAYPAMPVTVKTPACPATVYLPGTAAQGTWEFEELQDGLQGLMRLDAKSPMPDGFVLLGPAATARRQSLTAQMAALPSAH